MFLRLERKERGIHKLKQMTKNKIKPPKSGSRVQGKVFVRLGFQDAVVPVADAMGGAEISSFESFLIGFEDENGNECNQNGVYL